jgi:osmoprotectant transport system permease protein
MLIEKIWKYLHNPYLWDTTRQDSIPVLFFNHLSIVGWSMFYALLVAAPISFLVARYERLYLPVITVAGVIYTIPSVVLLALLVQPVGLNQDSVIIPLVAYAQVVLIRNFVAAIRSVDPTLLEVGRAMGMSELQLLWRVTLPLALPIIIAGVRVATVTTIGIATIAPIITVPDLGTLIFNGFEPLNPAEILTGAILITLIAVTADLALLGVQRLLNRGRVMQVAQ